MKAILILSFLVLVGLRVSANSKSSKDLYIPLGSGDHSNAIPTRTFKPINTTSHRNNVNFKPALLSVTPTSLGKKADLALYSLYFTGTIDITPGGNKFWDLESNSEIIDEIDKIGRAHV